MQRNLASRPLITNAVGVGLSAFPFTNTLRDGDKALSRIFRSSSRMVAYAGGVADSVNSITEPNMSLVN